MKPFPFYTPSSDGYAIKALKQKQMVDGLCYLLQEIYGIENKKSPVDATKGVAGGEGGITCDDDTDDNGSECVICMSDVRDTLILPCRHLCLCNGCADSLRYQVRDRSLHSIVLNSLVLVATF